MATHSSILAWRIPWTGEPGGLQSMGTQGVGHELATNTEIPRGLFLLGRPHRGSLQVGVGVTVCVESWPGPSWGSRLLSSPPSPKPLSEGENVAREVGVWERGGTQNPSVLAEILSQIRKALESGSHITTS